MLIGIACRQNRMRSPFVVAVLSQLTQHNFFSFGSDTRRGTRASGTVIDLIAELGFHHEWRLTKESTSKNLEDIAPQIVETSLVLCLDQSVFETLQIGLSHDSISKFAVAAGDDDFLTASDPVSLTKDQTRLEVYKAALKSIQTLRKMNLLPKSNIHAYMPMKESDLTELVQQLCKKNDDSMKHLVISLDFYTPMAHLFDHGNVKAIPVSNINEIASKLIGNLDKGSGCVFFGAPFEIPYTYSGVFREIHEISKLGFRNVKVSLVLPNLDSSYQISALSILGAWFADQVTMVGASNPNFAKGVSA